MQWSLGSDYYRWFYALSSSSLCRYVNKASEIPPRDGGQFIRKGTVGDWRNHFSSPMNLEWDEWINEHLKGSGLDRALGI